MFYRMSKLVERLFTRGSGTGVRLGALHVVGVRMQGCPWPHALAYQGNCAANFGQVVGCKCLVAI